MLVIEWFVVDQHLFTENLNLVPGKTDDALDKILIRIHGINENDHIAPFGVTDGNQGFVSKGNLNTIQEFVHQDMIAHQKGGFHGARRDLKGLHHKGSNKKRQKNGNDRRLGIFPKYSFFFNPLLDFRSFNNVSFCTWLLCSMEIQSFSNENGCEFVWEM